MVRAGDNEAVALDSSGYVRRAARPGRVAFSAIVLVAGAAMHPGCQPIPQSYYDWLAAGGGYYDGDAPLFHGQFINECRLHDADHPRDCRMDVGRLGSSGIGSGDPAPFGHSLALSPSGRQSGRTGASAPPASGMTGHSTSSSGGGASHGGHAGGGHGGHGGR